MESTANDFPQGWKYQEGDGIYYLLDHIEAVPIHFAESGSRKHTSPVSLT